mmetsp:Transcript_6442/g.15936  ORF Transcript_6442/g.15936 Transcript_6442/m.15936 type:complete len:319 (+) Transcript_6442:913-1869(+)
MMLLSLSFFLLLLSFFFTAHQQACGVGLKIGSEGQGIQNKLKPHAPGNTQSSERRFGGHEIPVSDVFLLSQEPNQKFLNRFFQVCQALFSQKADIRFEPLRIGVEKADDGYQMISLWTHVRFLFERRRREREKGASGVIRVPTMSIGAGQLGKKERREQERKVPCLKESPQFALKRIDRPLSDRCVLTSVPFCEQLIGKCAIGNEQGHICNHSKSVSQKRTFFLFALGSMTKAVCRPVRAHKREFLVSTKCPPLCKEGIIFCVVDGSVLRLKGSQGHRGRRGLDLLSQMYRRIHQPERRERRVNSNEIAHQCKVTETQ